MTRLTLAARAFLLQQPTVTSLVGTDDLGDPMIYANQPEATIENTSTSMIVITSTDGWGANEHNTARFPILYVDIWSDPTRNADLSVRRRDADSKLEKVYLAVDKFFHLVHQSAPGGASIMWGTAQEIQNRTGQRIITSTRKNEPDINPALNSEGTLIGRVRYDLTI